MGISCAGHCARRPAHRTLHSRQLRLRGTVATPAGPGSRVGISRGGGQGSAGRRSQPQDRQTFRQFRHADAHHPRQDQRGVCDQFGVFPRHENLADRRRRHLHDPPSDGKRDRAIGARADFRVRSARDFGISRQESHGAGVRGGPHSVHGGRDPRYRARGLPHPGAGALPAELSVRHTEADTVAASAGVVDRMRSAAGRRECPGADVAIAPAQRRGCARRALRMRILRQCAVVLGLGFSGLPRRKWSSLAMVVSMACVIGVLLSMLSFTSGMLRAYGAGGDPDFAVVLSPDNGTEYGNAIPPAAVGTILDAPGIAAGPDGHPLGDAEVLLWVPPMPSLRFTGSPELRGIGAAGLALRPNLSIVAGRMFHFGRQELIVGVRAARAYGLHIGDGIALPGGEWPIVGMFTDGGSILEGQLVGDAITVISAGHASGFGSVLVRLTRPDAFGAFSRWVASNPALKVTAERRAHYDARTV